VIKANNFNERDNCLEAQEAFIQKVLEEGNIVSNLLKHLLDPIFLCNIEPLSFNEDLVKNLNPSQR
jgi:hypothetical protein